MIVIVSSRADVGYDQAGENDMDQSSGPLTPGAKNHDEFRLLAQLEDFRLALRNPLERACAALSALLRRAVG